MVTREERAMNNSLKQAECEVQLGKLRERDRRSALRQMAKSSESEEDEEEEEVVGEVEEVEDVEEVEEVEEESKKQSADTTEGGFLGQAVAQAKVATADQVEEEDITLDEDL